MTQKQMVSMYSLYMDLNTADLGNSPRALAIASNIQKTRDEENRMWMVDHAINTYPKSVADHQKDRSLFEARTTTHENVAFLFSVKENNAEVYCKVVHKGQWSTHASLQNAQRSLLNIMNHQKIRNHLNVVYK